LMGTIKIHECKLIAQEAGKPIVQVFFNPDAQGVQENVVYLRQVCSTEGWTVGEPAEESDKRFRVTVTGCTREQFRSKLVGNTHFDFRD
jgi:hypothetical protein